MEEFHTFIPYNKFYKDVINIIKTYNLENYPLEQLICSETCQVDQNTHLIDEKTCKSLNQDILNN